MRYSPSRRTASTSRSTRPVPHDPPTVDNARALVTSLFFNFRRYDLGRVGRYKLNKALADVAAKLKIDLPSESSENLRDARVISRNDITAIIGKLIELNNGRGQPDDIDHLGNRRIRANGELIQNQFRIGLLRMERVVKERMTITDSDQATPNTLINIRPVVAAMKEFFGGSQLSPVHGPDQPAGRADQQAAPVGARAPAACRANAPASTSATCTPATTAGCARSRRRRARTSA